MSKRFESGAWKRKKKRLQDNEIKKLTPITAYMHEPTSTIQLEENFTEAIQQAVCEETAVASTQNENTELIQELLTEHEDTNKPQENNTDIQNFLLTHNEKPQVQGISNSNSDVVKNISTTVTDVGLWVDLSQNDVSYWIEKGPSQIQHHCGHFLIPSDYIRISPGFIQNLFSIQQEPMEKNIPLNGLCILLEKVEFIALFVNSFQILQLLQQR